MEGKGGEAEKALSEDLSARVQLAEQGTWSNRSGWRQQR